MERNPLYFYYTGGAGNVICKDCGYTEKVTSFIHGDAVSWTGVQCDKCGKFESVKDWQEKRKPVNCDCGGELKREEPIFCPFCRSTNMKYSMRYIT